MLAITGGRGAGAGRTRALRARFAKLIVSSAALAFFALPDSDARAEPPAEGDSPDVSGRAALGAGVIARDPASLLDLGLDVAGTSYAVGVGGRIHYMASGGIRTEDWDDLSEIFGFVRYALYETSAASDPLSFAAAAGELGDVRQGHGSVMGGYASGLSLNRGRFGAQVRAAYDEAFAEAMIDDLAGPRIVGLRAAAPMAPDVAIGVSFAADARAPAAGGEAAVGLAAIDGELRGSAGDGRYRGRLYLDLASAAGLGAGLHAGAGGSARLGEGGLRAGARAELRLSSGGYVPGWFGPLYERDRQVIAPGPEGGASQLDLARRGALGGASGLGELRLEWPGAASGSLSYASRPALADHWLLRVEAPHFQRLQGALWAAFAPGSEPGRGGALAAELRVLLPAPFQASVDVARLYRERPGGAPEPVWTGIASVGAGFGG